MTSSSSPSHRITRRRSSAGSSNLQPPNRQSPNRQHPNLQSPNLQPQNLQPQNLQSPSRPQSRPPLRIAAHTPRPPFLTLNDHGRVYVADLPKLSDGQLGNLAREASEVFTSLEQRIAQLEADLDATPRDAVIRACTKRDVTARFMKAIEEEQSSRRNNPQLMAAAGESVSRAFMEVARQRLPGGAFDSLLQEAVNLVNQQEEGRQRNSHPTERLPVVVSDMSDMSHMSDV